ncbi:CGNR zinc finger domain-containing protein [Aminobacter sp. AP02]|uniref:CGNR zinc finger domain-containing protein n=1 Tax=Aminobacter sp. AP02 TaxID=2135737 RepID=UPI000D6C74C9|nr:CGNR zinc finger domain-containing protein [Aminobacter sp. AP02]PWK65758.1 putative RNA-binding Zn ribbon-like protein [Aminobacter sp. AP02]
MSVAWTRHRFSGGALALDTANTVVLRGDGERSFDRFDDPLEIARFAASASGYRADELKGRALAAPDPHAIVTKVIAIRETTDQLFRRTVIARALPTAGMPAFLNACADGLAGSHELLGPNKPFGASQEPLAFEVALAVSALSLLSSDTVSRMRICPNCGWLFVDRSRNGSRMWCDMAVCGNRQKARRHYNRRKEVANA